MAIRLLERANYGIPTWGSSLGYPVPGIWRMDWLRNVGIDKVPATLDEMYTALWKFRHEDPDGNGIQDTYGMCPNAQAWFNVFGEVFGAYGIVPHGWMLRDGEVVWGGTRPEVKEILGLLRKWYDDGLIDPDFAIGQIKSSPMPYQKFVSGKTGYLFGQGSYGSFDKYNKASLVSVIAELQPGAEVVVGPFPAGPEGIRGGRVWSTAAHVFVFGKQVAAAPEKVVRMLKIFEALAVEEKLFVEVRMGQRGVHWEFDAERGLYHLPPYDDRNVASKHLTTLSVDGPGGFFFSPRVGVNSSTPRHCTSTSTCRRRCCNTASAISAPSGRRPAFSASRTWCPRRSSICAICATCR